MALDHGGDLVVLQRRAGGAERGLLVVEEGLHGGADRLHVDAVPVHVGEPQIEVEDFARHRPLHHLAGDLHDDRAVGLGSISFGATRGDSLPSSRMVSSGSMWAWMSMVVARVIDRASE